MRYGCAHLPQKWNENCFPLWPVSRYTFEELKYMAKPDLSIIHEQFKMEGLNTDRCPSGHLKD